MELEARYLVRLLLASHETMTAFMAARETHLVTLLMFQIMTLYPWLFKVPIYLKKKDKTKQR